MTDFSSKSKMGAELVSRRWRLKLGLAAALATMALVAPTALASATTPATGDVVLHRDGSKAVPFQAYPVASKLPTQWLCSVTDQGDSSVADLARPGPRQPTARLGNAAVGLAQA